MNNIIFSDKEKLDKILENIKKDGASKLHFLADFDNTLTKAFVDGKKSASMVAVLRGEEKLLGEECAIEEEQLFNYYHPIEFDSKIGIKEKKELMLEWWTKSLQLFVKYGLTIEKLNKISQTEKIQLREGTDNLLKKLNNNNIPFIIISASGFGKKSIELFLNFRDLYLNNIDIISNDLIWNENGLAIDYNKTIIHSFNKDETILEKFTEIHNKIENRKNIILLGDSLGDHHMSDGFKYDNLLKIGFLNYREEENLEEYKKRYDVIMTGDGDFEYLNNFLNEFLT